MRIVTFAELVQGTIKFDARGFRFQTSILRALGVAVPLVACFLAGHPAWGVLAGIGALYTGTASFGGIQPVRVRRMLAASVGTAAITGFACLINRGDAIAVTGVTLMAFVLAIVASLNAGANVVGIQAMGALIIISGIPESGADPTGNALLVLAGGIFQTGLLSLFGPIFPFTVERAAVARVYSEMAAFVRRLDENQDEVVPASEPFLEAVARMEEAEYTGLRPIHLPLKNALRIGETLRAALVGFSREYRMKRRAGGCSVSEELAATHLADALDKVSSRIPNTDYPPSNWGIAEAFSVPAEAERGMCYWLNLMQKELGQIGLLEGEAEPITLKKRWIPNLKPLTGLFDSHLLQGSAGKHALRYAVAVGLSVALSRASHVDHSYWFPLTVAFILRSDYASTLSKGIGRAIGTILGVGVASAIDAWLHPSIPVLIGLVVLATWIAFSVYLANYSAFTFAVTLFVVFSVSATGLSEKEIGDMRVVSTLLGVAAAFLFAFAWPLWQSNEVAYILTDAFRAQEEYGHSVARFLAGGKGADVEEMRRRARSLRMEAQTLIQAASVEPSGAARCIWRRVQTT